MRIHYTVRGVETKVKDRVVLNSAQSYQFLPRCVQYLIMIVRRVALG
jgi:hypothetical protein